MHFDHISEVTLQDVIRVTEENMRQAGMDVLCGEKADLRNRLVVQGHYVFFLCFRWALALDLGRALPKNMGFFLPSARIRVSPISEKT